MAAKPIPALDYLAQPDKYPPQPVCAVFGDEPFLRHQVIGCLRTAVLGGGDGDFSLSTFEGRGASFRDVHEVLSTVAMFGGGKRLVVVEEADDFVTRCRTPLEDYVARPSRSGVLVLDLDSLPSNTRLYKSIAAGGLLIDGGTPAPARLCKWLVEWAKQRHHVQLPQAAAEMLVELVGPELGLLDQELAKLALLAGDDKKIAPELVSRSVGGWRAKTTWEMLDAASDGNVREALLQVDRLLACRRTTAGALGSDFGLAAPLCRRHAVGHSGRGRPPTRECPRGPGTSRHSLVRASKGRAATAAVGTASRRPALPLAVAGRSGSEGREHDAATAGARTTHRAARGSATNSLPLPPGEERSSPLSLRERVRVRAV